jgi:hypothetical protein
MTCRLSAVATLVTGAVLMLMSSSAAVAVDSGPNAGDKLEPFTLSILSNGTEYQEQQWKPAADEKLTVYAFVQSSEWSRPMSRLIREVDTTLGELPGGPAMLAVWVTDDEAAAKTYLPRGRDALQLRNTTYGVFADPSGPNNWGINSKAALTIVIARGEKAIRSFAYISVNETDAPEVQQVLKQAAK